VTKCIVMTVINLVSAKAAAKLKLLSNKPVSSNDCCEFGHNLSCNQDQAFEQQAHQFAVFLSQT
jgi:hypothetical protein